MFNLKILNLSVHKTGRYGLIIFFFKKMSPTSDKLKYEKIPERSLMILILYFKEGGEE